MRKRHYFYLSKFLLGCIGTNNAINAFTFVFGFDFHRRGSGFSFGNLIQIFNEHPRPVEKGTPSGPYYCELVPK